MNPFEAIRLVLSLICIGINLYGYQRINNGLVAFDQAIRGSMKYRRWVQMIVYTIQSICLFIMAYMGSITIDLQALTWTSIIINLCYLVLIISLGWLSLYQTLGWVKFQFLLGNTPLNASEQERLELSEKIARNMGHDISNYLQEIILIQEGLLEDERVPMDVKVELQRNINKTEKFGELIHQRHILVKEINDKNE